jgi:hypothetical protein
MFKSLLIYDFKFLTKNRNFYPEKPSPQEDKILQRSGGGGPLNS